MTFNVNEERTGAPSDSNFQMTATKFSIGEKSETKPPAEDLKEALGLSIL